MTYLGDPSLAPDIQNRVLSTFDQTAKLASEGKRQEAQLGCDFILRLDPLFAPAMRLQERLDEGEGPIDDALDLLADSYEPPPESHKTVRLSTEELQRMIGDVGNDSPGEGGDDSPDLIQHGPLAEDEPWPANDTEQGEEGALAEAISFLGGARRALDSGQLEPARRLLDMAGALDPHSPELIEMRGELEAMAAEPAGAGGGGDRIAQLLAEGQHAFDAERYQDAIDCWSRIFLIEIDHDEASRRIQLARDLREEQDRQVEETFHQGVAAADSGQADAATRAFRRVLELRPNHLAAQEQLDRLTAASHRDLGGAADGEPALAAAAPASDGVARGSSLAAEAPRQADPSYRMAARAKRKPVNPFFLIGAVVMVLLAGGAWYLMENWSRFFPNAKEEVAQTLDRVKVANAMRDSGNLEGGIAKLEEIGSDSPDYLQARKLLARWREELAARSTDVGEPLTGDDAFRHDTLVTEARRAYDGHSYLDAARLFTRASAMAPLPAAEAALFEDSKRQLEPIAQQIDLYTQRQWDLALPALWRRHEQSPNDKDVHQLLVNSYYNLAIRELRKAELAKAAEYVKEASRLEHSDAELERLDQFVTSYLSLPRDLLYEIYVGNLDFRR